MPRFEHGDIVIETAVPTEIVALRSQGFTEVAPFDPSEASASEVLGYLAAIDGADPEVHDAEVVRVLESERAGKARKSVIEAVEGSPAGEASAAKTTK